MYGSAVDQILASEDSASGASGAVLWGLGDNEGTIRDVVSNATQQVVEHRTFDAFGKNTSPWAVDFIHGYTGQALDSATGLIDLGRRWYDAPIGRPISEDPSGFSAGDMNLYRYVGNNPLNNTDPSGLCSRSNGAPSISSLLRGSNYSYNFGILGSTPSLSSMLGSDYSSNNFGLGDYSFNRQQQAEFASEVASIRQVVSPTLKNIVYTNGREGWDDMGTSLYRDSSTGDWRYPNAPDLSEPSSFTMMASGAIAAGAYLGAPLAMAAYNEVGYATGAAYYSLPTVATSPLTWGTVAGAGTYAYTGDVETSVQVGALPVLMMPGRASGDLAGAYTRLRGATSVSTAMPSQLAAGEATHAQWLRDLGVSENTTVWRPTVAQTQSAGFQVVVGEPKFTPGGLPAGTVIDVTQSGLVELKSGASILNSSYQLRLQTYRSLIENTPYTIQTTRPINPTFQNYLQKWGVKVEPPH